VSRLIQCVFRAVDRWQRRNRVVAVLVAVHRKSGEDRAGDLAAVLAFYGFFSLFPLLILLATVAGFVLDSHPELRTELINAAVEQFPESPELRDAITTLEGDGVALIVGLVGTLWGGLAVVNALRTAFDVAWAVPIRDRAGLVPAALRNLGVVAIAAVGLVGSAVLGAANDVVADVPIAASAAGHIGSLAVGGAVFWALFWFLSPRDVRLRALLPGVAVVTVGSWLLQQLGSIVVARQLGERGAATGVFAAGAVLLTWLALQARLTVLSVELDAVLARRWWPRSLDAARPEASDLRTLRAHATTEERIPGERVDVGFDEAERPPATAGMGRETRE
jgi:uncharacterized BrkB/YihY/UPF0761 family membrane protein